jgi:hypothetical protein
MMRTARFVVSIAFLFTSALQLDAQSTASPGSPQKHDDQEARIHRVEATVLDIPMGEKQAPLRLDL